MKRQISQGVIRRVKLMVGTFVLCFLANVAYTHNYVAMNTGPVIQKSKY